MNKAQATNIAMIMFFIGLVITIIYCFGKTDLGKTTYTIKGHSNSNITQGRFQANQSIPSEINIPEIPEHPYVRPIGTRFRIVTNGERYKIQEWKWTPRLNLTPSPYASYDWVDVTGAEDKTIYFGGLWAAESWIKRELTEHPSPSDKWVEVKR